MTTKIEDILPIHTELDTAQDKLFKARASFDGSEKQLAAIKKMEEGLVPIVKRLMKAYEAFTP